MKLRSVPKESGRPLAVLAAGVVATIILVLAASTISVFNVERARQHALRAESGAEHATLLISQLDQIGWLVNTMRVLALQTIATPESAPGAYAQKRLMDRELLVRVDQLGPFLNARERRVWRELRPDLYVLRSATGQLQAAIEREDDVEAARLLEEDVAPRIAQLESALNALKELHLDDRTVLAGAVEEHLSRVWLIVVLVHAILVLVLCAIWVVVGRLIHRNQRLVTEYTARVEEANHELDAFAGRVAHDLLNALTPVATAGAILSCEPALSDRGREATERLSRSVNRTRNLLGGLLAFARAGEPDDSGRASVADVCRAVLEEHQDRVTRADVKVEQNVPAGVEVRCPEGLLHSVLSNLVSNALKFVSGRPERRVTISAQPAGDSAELVVTDTGPGLSADVAARVFEPFYREPGTSVEGHGLGLATVRRIVESHGGQVAVVSRRGHGASFKVTLPLASAAGPSA